MIQKIYPLHFHEILLINFLDNMVIAPKDFELRIYIIRRLHTLNKINQFEEFLPGYSYNNVKDIIIFYALSMGYINAFKYYRNKDQDTKIQVNRRVIKNLEAFTAELRNTFRP